MAIDYLTEKRTRETYLKKKFAKSRSPNTVQNCETALKNLDRFCFTKYGKNSADEVIEDLKTKPLTTVCDFLNGFVQWKTGNCKASALNQYFSIITNYLFYHGIKLYPQDIRAEITLPKNDVDQKPLLEIESIKKILDYSSASRRGLYMLQLCSGVRISEAVGLRKIDFSLKLDRIMIKIPKTLTKNDKARRTFVSLEAEKYLRPILDSISDGDLVCGTNKNREQAVRNEEQVFNKMRKRAKMIDKFEGSRINKITIHSFRHFFVSKCEKINSGLGHYLAGHERYMAEYENYTDKELFDFYLEVEPYLSIYNGEEYLKTTTELSKKVQNQEKEIKGDKIRLEMMEKELEKLRDVIEQEGYEEEEPDMIQYAIDSEVYGPNRITIDPTDDSKLLVNIKKALIGLEKRIEERNKKAKKE